MWDIALETMNDYRATIRELEEENWKLRDIIKHKRFSERYVEWLQEENRILKHKNELQEIALIRLCLKHHYDSIIIEWEEVIDMSNYKIVEKKNPTQESIF